MGNGVAAAAQRALQTASDALSNIGRPVCKTYRNIGVPVIASCCECGDGSNGELSIHFTRMYDAEASTLDEIIRVRPCKGGTIAAQFRMVLARCFPTVDEHGEVPDPEVLQGVAEEQDEDIEALWLALACSGERIRIDDITADENPMGGCSIVYVDLTVQVQPVLPSV